MNNILRHSVVGLPRSGKTTFLAAFWHLLSSDELELRMQLRSMTGDTAYLDNIAEKWRRCVPIGRTLSMEAEYIELALTEVGSQNQFDLCFPDVAGESYEEQIKTRMHDKPHAEWLRHPGGTLLFLNASEPPDGLTLEALDGLLDEEVQADGAEIADEDASTNVEEGEEVEDHIPWQPKYMPEQVKLVELLQILDYLDENLERNRIAVLVSAWDTVANEGLTPQQWLARERPLLWQYLQTNSPKFNSRVFGISAQGGDETRDKQALLSKPSPSERVICVDEEYLDHDLTRPIVWLNRAI